MSAPSTHGVRGQWVIICLLLISGYDQATHAAHYVQAHNSPAVYWAYPGFKFDLQTSLLTAFCNSNSLQAMSRIVPQIVTQTLPYLSFSLCPVLALNSA